jgi:hypothetical protein
VCEERITFERFIVIRIDNCAFFIQNLYLFFYIPFGCKQIIVKKK